jgi:hypothetical protein
MKDAHFTYIWRYRVKADRRSEFLDAYRPGGEWTALFARDASYVDTKLMRDADCPDRYLTIDTWLSRSDCDAFRDRHAKEFDDLDRKCESFTEHEELIGNFESGSFESVAGND